MKSKAFSRVLRKNQTDAERLLWKELRAGKLTNIKFRRQHPVGPYFADFCSIEEKLIVELDGGQHASRQAGDFNRTEFLESRGFKVIRFWDHEVLRNIEAVVEMIRTSLIKSPSPQPSPSRERGIGKGFFAKSLASGGEGERKRTS